MSRYWLCLVAVVMLALAAGSAFSQVIPYVIRYYGDVAPDTPGSCGTSLGRTYQWKLCGTDNDTGMGVLIEDDPDAIDGRSYRVYDDSGLGRLVWRTDSENLDSGAGATIVARMKSVWDENGGGNFGINGSGIAALAHWGGLNGDITEVHRGITGNVPGDSNYHVWRVTSQGNDRRTSGDTITFTGYVDSNLADRSEHGVAWDGNAASEIAVVGETVQVTGGRITDTTHAELEVICDPDESGKITISVDCKQGVAGSEGWVFSMFAIDGAGNQMAGWMGNCMNQVKGRVGTDTPLRSLKTDGTYSLLTMVIDCSTDPKRAEYFVDGVSIGTVTYPVAKLDAPGVNRLAKIRIESFKDYRTATNTVFLDNISLQGTPLRRTIKLYVDENPTPVAVIDNASAQQGLQDTDGNVRDCFVMGSASISGIQDVYFDYVTGTGAGAFAPGAEVGVLGYTLALDPVACTSIECAKSAGPSKLVRLSEVMVTSVFSGLDANGFVNPIGFGIEEIVDTETNYERVGPRGMRVVSSYPDLYAGATVDVTGFVQVENGEPVLHAVSVVETGYRDPVLPPLTMTNKASGGAFLPTFHWEPFSYPDGSLSGRGGWLGAVSPRLAVTDNSLKVCGGWQSPEAVSRSLLLLEPSGNVSVSLKAKKGVGSDNTWDVFIRDAAGVDLAHWYGSGSVAKMKTSDTTNIVRNLTGGWDDLGLVISGDSTTYSFNGETLATVSHSGAPAVAEVVISRNGRGATTDYINFDSLALSESSSVSGLPTLGLFTSIFGKVTGRTYNGDWDDYFYIDDGSAIFDGNDAGWTGIRCRSASHDYGGIFNTMPLEDSAVMVTGVMGLTELNGKVVRYFWTWDYTAY